MPFAGSGEVSHGCGSGISAAISASATVAGAPLIDTVAAEYEGRIKVGKVNVDDNPATPGKYGVRGIPTVILLKDGKVVDQVVGAIPKAQLEALIQKAL